MQIQRTPHGFDCRAATTLRSAPLADGPRAWLRPWSCAKIECLASDEKKELQERLARIEALEKEMGA